MALKLSRWLFCAQVLAIVACADDSVRGPLAVELGASSNRVAVDPTSPEVPAVGAASSQPEAESGAASVDEYLPMTSCRIGGAAHTLQSLAEQVSWGMGIARLRVSGQPAVIHRFDQPGGSFEAPSVAFDVLAFLTGDGTTPAPRTAYLTDMAHRTFRDRYGHVFMERSAVPTASDGDLASLGADGVRWALVARNSETSAWFVSTTFSGDSDSILLSDGRVRVDAVVTLSQTIRASRDAI